MVLYRPNGVVPEGYTKMLSSLTGEPALFPAFGGETVGIAYQRGVNADPVGKHVVTDLRWSLAVNAADIKKEGAYQRLQPGQSTSHILKA